MRNMFFACAAVLALAAPAAAQDPGPSLVTTTGTAVVERAPDRAFVTVGVEARAPQTVTAREKVAVAMTAIQRALKALGIPETAIRTSALNVAQDWEFLPQGRRNLRGYVVSNQIEVRVDDIAAVTAVIDDSITAGANVIHGVRWDVKDRASLEREALQRAYADARARAEVIAAASGRKLGAVFAAQESRPGQVSPRMYSANAGVAGMAEAVRVTDMPISPGQIDIRSTVTVSWILQ